MIEYATISETGEKENNEDAVKKVCLDIENKVAERNRIIQLSR